MLPSYMATSATRCCAVLFATLLLSGCGDTESSSQSAAVLPPNPAEWACPEQRVDVQQWCRDNAERGLPASLPVPAPLSRLTDKNFYDVQVLQTFLRGREYIDLGWKHDRHWRFTGPYVGTIGAGNSFGTHPAVRIYYSPEIIDWLCAGRTGHIPDGAMIVKETHAIEPCLDVALDADGCMVIRADPEPDSWTVMIKASAESQDGWYWGGISQPPADPPVFAWQLGNPPILDRSAITSDDFFSGSSVPPSVPNPLWYPTGYVFQDHKKIPDVATPFSDYGGDCINCHASAAVESTFSALDNVIGPGRRFKGYGFAPGRCGEAGPEEEFAGYEHAPGVASLVDQEASAADTAYVSPFSKPLSQTPAGFTDLFGQIQPVPFTDAWEQRLPAETYDHVVAASSGPAEFVTADQCAPCHDATVSNARTPEMVFRQSSSGSPARLVNLSPYGEWKASPMGLAGRDPIFFAQLQSETNNLPQLTACIENTCLHCHGVMGQRQLAIDTNGQDDDRCKQIFGIAPPPEVPFGRAFRRAMVTQWPESDPSSEQRYGGLARDGISCTVCHHLSDQNLGEEQTFTGNFVTGPADELYGPYETDSVVPKSMEHAVGITPKFGEHMQGSDTCSSCHNILLPVFDNDGQLLDYSYEQATHLEWVNSDFAPGRPNFRSCQDCHMPTSFAGTVLRSTIANIESNEFAPATFRLPDEDITLEVRDHYARHSLHGLNVFLNQMFQQFPLLLGYRQMDYQTGTLTVPPLVTGFDSMLDMAANDTAAVAIKELKKTNDGKLSALVEVTSKVGHFLPSGVGFRRLFLEVIVFDAQGNMLWASGRTNALGAIVDGRTQRVLPSESVVAGRAGQCVNDASVPFEPHHEVVEREDQVQIYQELIKDSAGVLTTSFLRRADEVKDNRLRPKGFDPAMFAQSPSPYIRKLAELHGQAEFDPHYYDPSLTGSDEIQYLATLDAVDLAKVDHVQVTLYSQSIPPFYLQQRFRDANCGAQAKDDIERLYYLASRLNVDDPTDTRGAHPIESWKLRVAAATRRVTD
jgi:hypothetical protein